MTRTQPYHHGSLKAALLDSAETIMSRDGLGALTLRAVARGAGVSHAAPTHHFGDLTGLLSDLAARGFDRFAARMRTAAEAASSDRLNAVARAYVAFARDNPAMFLLMFRSDRLDPKRPDLQAAMAAAFADLVAGAKTRGSGNRIPAIALATRRWSLVHGFAMLLIDRRLEPLFAAAPGLTADSLLDAMLDPAEPRSDAPQA